LVKREIILLTLCALFVAYIPFTSYHFDTKFEMTSIFKSAYGQTPGPGDPGNNGGPGNSISPSDPGNTGSSGGLGGSGNPGGLGTGRGSSGPDPSAGDNSTNPSNPGDVSPVIGNSTNDMPQNDTSSGPDSAIALPSNTGNPTTAQTVPEFPVAMLVMIISISSVVVFSRIKSFKI